MTFLVVFLSMFNLSVGQTFQIHNGDTINVVDANNMKQGHWIYFGSMKPMPNFTPEAKVEEGDFENNRKSGMWIKYYPDGTKHSEITFSHNRPNGPYKTYYQNGQLEEEGVWQNNRNVEEFRRFYENGQKQQEFIFNTNGKRDGPQTYYFDNGNKMIELTIKDGKEDGWVTEYYANGDIKSKKFFSGGVIDPAKTEKFEPKNALVEKTEEKGQESKVVTSDEAIELGNNEGDKPPVKIIKAQAGANLHGVPDGQHTLYNSNRRITQSGIFKGGRLWDGKRYKYDDNGILEAIEIYKDGHYIGEGVIEE